MCINISSFSFWRNVPEYWFLDREVNYIAMIGCPCWMWFLKLDLENIFVLVLISNIYVNLAHLIFLSIYWCVCGGWGFDLLGLAEIRIPFLMNGSKCCLHNSFEHQTWERQGNMACLPTGKRNPGDYNFNMEAILLRTKRSRKPQKEIDFLFIF